MPFTIHICQTCQAEYECPFCGTADSSLCPTIYDDIQCLGCLDACTEESFIAYDEVDDIEDANLHNL